MARIHAPTLAGRGSRCIGGQPDRGFGQLRNLSNGVRWGEGRVTLVCRNDDLVVRHTRPEAGELVLAHEP